MAGISESRLNMWKALVSLGKADGELHLNEIGYLKDVFCNLDLNSSQKDQLFDIMDEDYSDLEISGFYKSIGLPEDRSQFFYLARILCWIDGEFSKAEVDVIEKLQEIYLSDVESSEMTADLGKKVFRSFQKQSSYHENTDIPLSGVIIDAVNYWEENSKVEKVA